MAKKVKRPAMASSLNPAGVWESTPAHLARGHAGEQSIGFYLGEAGYFIIEGPSGAGGHGANAHGFDGVAFHPESGELILYDNKAWKKTGVDSATALRENLIKNLDEQIERIELHRAAGNEIPHAERILEMLKGARAAAKAGKDWPKAVKLYVYGASGRATRITRKLATSKGGLQIEFKSWQDLKRARNPWYKNPAARKAVGELDEDVLRLEKAAADAIIKRESKKLGGQVAERGAKFVEKRLPKLIAEGVLKGSAKAAAHRAASLVPVIGWAFDAEDAYHGVEDILRGHTARGLAGIGLAIGDVAADFLHLGDAVSGVGGTALSIGVQGGIMAGQIELEMERQEEKMQEMGEEIQRNNQLPPDDRLRDYYGLDDDSIADLKREFQMQEDAAEPPPELPELPPDVMAPPPLIPDLPLPPALPPAPPAPKVQPAPPPPVSAPPKVYEEYGPGNWWDQPIC